ncbi:30S ribosomal protein S1 [bacterium]|nr:30S ribosomal protein S1 [bacterium]
MKESKKQKETEKAVSKTETSQNEEEQTTEDMDGSQEYEESLEDLYDESFRNIVEGEVVRGKILQITENEILIDVGYKSEGVIPLVEFQSYLEEENLKIGDEIDVYLEKTEDSNGLVVLSKEKADKIKIWDQIQNAYDNEEILKGKVIERIKGGLNVDIGVKAFLPGSQIDLRPVRDPQSLIGQTLEMKVIKLNKRRGNIVLSRRAILENKRKEQKEKTLSILEEGALVSGIVKNITEYGAFIDLGGIDGLLHITDMSWGRVNHPSEMFIIGDKIEVMVLKFDREKERVSLGYKQKTPDPWESVETKYPVGAKVKGKVISITDYGAFVELEEGVEGLVHVSEMSWSRRIRNHSKLVAIGDMVEAIVLNLDKENKRISLGMKQVEPNPWKIIEDKYTVGSEVTGRVRNLTNFGAFIELDEGIDGLVHISDMSWTKRINHPSEIVKKGERVKAVILDIDAKNERLSLGIKQLLPDPWDLIQDKYPAGSVIRGKVVRISEFGAFVELEDGIEGLVHVSELDKKHVNNPEDVVKIDEEYTMKVIKIDPDERKIGLSIKAYLESLDQSDVNDYIQKQSEHQELAKMGDLLKRKSLDATTSDSDPSSEEPKTEPKKRKTASKPIKAVSDELPAQTDTDTAEQHTAESLDAQADEAKDDSPASQTPEPEPEQQPVSESQEPLTDPDVTQSSEEPETDPVPGKKVKDSKNAVSKLDDVDSMISKIKGSIKAKKDAPKTDEGEEE